MAPRVVAIVAVLLVTGCGQRQDAFPCTDDASCGVGGKCEPGFNLCSFTNLSCPGGRSFGDLGGPNSGRCVDSTPLPDGGMPDAPPDAPMFCYGTGLVKVCFSAPPSNPLAIENPTTLDTGTGTSTGISLTCATPLSGGTGYCVVLATNITIDSSLRATGTKPLVLVASGTIMTGAAIDVGSHRGQNPETGAGADPGSCATMGTTPTNSGGGAGGSFIGLGGVGGNGNGAAAGGGVPGAVSDALTAVRGGCPGQDGNAPAANDRGRLGHGGGAVFLIAGTKIDIQGNINAAGEGGTPGDRNSAGGGGGGAGGMIGFDAPMISATALILANGGGGAEGSGTNNNAGAPGADPTTILAAVGGAGLSATGGDGGDGSAGVLTAGVGKPGTGGGGGGGGGAGLIKAPLTANLGANVSPLPAP